MSLLVDTNILLYAVNEEAPQHEAARAFLEERRRGGGFCVTWSILYECLRITTHPRVFPRPLTPSQAQAFVLGLASSTTVEMLTETSRHSAVLRELVAEAPPLRGNRYHDLHIAAVMRENGVSVIATADRHFRAFPSLRVIDPTSS